MTGKAFVEEGNAVETVENGHAASIKTPEKLSRKELIESLPAIGESPNGGRTSPVSGGQTSPVSTMSPGRPLSQCHREDSWADEMQDEWEERDREEAAAELSRKRNSSSVSVDSFQSGKSVASNSSIDIPAETLGVYGTRAIEVMLRGTPGKQCPKGKFCQPVFDVRSGAVTPKNLNHLAEYSHESMTAAQICALSIKRKSGALLETALQSGKLRFGHISCDEHAMPVFVKLQEELQIGIINLVTTAFPGLDNAFPWCVHFVDAKFPAALRKVTSDKVRRLFLDLFEAGLASLPDLLDALHVLTVLAESEAEEILIKLLSPEVKAKISERWFKVGVFLRAGAKTGHQIPFSVFEQDFALPLVEQCTLQISGATQQYKTDVQEIFEKLEGFAASQWFQRDDTDPNPLLYVRFWNQRCASRALTKTNQSFTNFGDVLRILDVTATRNQIPPLPQGLSDPTSMGVIEDIPIIPDNELVQTARRNYEIGSLHEDDFSHDMLRILAFLPFPLRMKRLAMHIESNQRDNRICAAGQRDICGQKIKDGAGFGGQSESDCNCDCGKAHTFAELCNLNCWVVLQDYKDQSASESVLKAELMPFSVHPLFTVYFPPKRQPLLRLGHYNHVQLLKVMYAKFNPIPLSEKLEIYHTKFRESAEFHPSSAPHSPAGNFSQTQRPSQFAQPFYPQQHHSHQAMMPPTGHEYPHNWREGRNYRPDNWRQDKYYDQSHDNASFQQQESMPQNVEQQWSHNQYYSSEGYPNSQYGEYWDPNHYNQYYHSNVQEVVYHANPEEEASNPPANGSPTHPTHNPYSTSAEPYPYAMYSTQQYGEYPSEGYYDSNQRYNQYPPESSAYWSTYST